MVLSKARARRFSIGQGAHIDSALCGHHAFNLPAYDKVAALKGQNILTQCADNLYKALPDKFRGLYVLIKM